MQSPLELASSLCFTSGGLAIGRQAVACSQGGCQSSVRCPEAYKPAGERIRELLEIRVEKGNDSIWKEAKVVDVFSGVLYSLIQNRKVSFKLLSEF